MGAEGAKMNGLAQNRQTAGERKVALAFSLAGALRLGTFA